MSNSKLVSYTGLSPNYSGKRTHAIDRITPHAVVGQLSVERICDCFKDRSRQASCNYCIGADGRIGLCVDEADRSWCSSSRDNDQRAVTIECASDLTEPYTQLWLADIIILAENRRKGYGTQGLRLLCDAAAHNGIDVLWDDIAIDNPGINLFLREGFTEEYRTDDIIMLKKELKQID